jgi:hypothetical protein
MPDARCLTLDVDLKTSEPPNSKRPTKNIAISKYRAAKYQNISETKYQNILILKLIQPKTR